jgi:hypothetical protein
VAESRFILLSIVVARPDDDGATAADGSAEVSWMLVSSNNRPLGRSATSFPGSVECRAGVADLRQRYRGIVSVIAPADGTGGWTWRVDLDGTAVAVSTRSYLRHHECDYNRQRFLEAVPEAELASSVRMVRGGGRR